MASQNRRHRARKTARKAGRRQKPHLFEHNMMAHGVVTPTGKRTDPDSSQDGRGAYGAMGATQAPC